MNALTTTLTAYAQNGTGDDSPDGADSQSTLLLRAMAREDRERASRWSAHGFPQLKPIGEFEDFASASRKRHDLAIERTALEKELRRAVTAISRGLLASRDNETERQAQDILDGRAEEAFEGFEELKAQVARLSQRTKAYAVAIRKQDEVVATIRSERSIDAADKLDSSHREAVAAIASAIASLRVALDREEAARTLVVQAGYDNRFPNFALAGLLSPGGRLDDLERRAIEHIR